MTSSRIGPPMRDSVQGWAVYVNAAFRRLLRRKSKAKADTAAARFSYQIERATDAG